MAGNWRTRAVEALAFERDERAVFKQMGRGVKSNMARQLFEQLALSGRSHLCRIREIAGVAEPEGLDDAQAQRLRELTEQAEAVGSDLEAIKLGLDLKRQACELYAELSRLADNPFEGRFWAELAQEERASLLDLLDLHDYHSDPQAYFTARERVTLEG